MNRRRAISRASYKRRLYFRALITDHIYSVSYRTTIMALPMLVGGSDCGPVNPLQGLSKRFDQDRGAQQVNPA